MLGALADPKHEEHEQHVEWVGKPFDPEAFDLKEVNWILRGGFADVMACRRHPNI